MGYSMRLLRVRFTVRGMMAAVAVVALALFSIELATLLLILAISSLAVRSLSAEPVGRSSRRWAVPYFVTLACLYLPFVWVARDHPWEESRWVWFKLWPVLPGLSVGLFGEMQILYYMIERDVTTPMTLFASAGAVFLIAVFTSLGSLGRAAMVVSNVIALIGASLESWSAYQLFMAGWKPGVPIMSDRPWDCITLFFFFPLSAVMCVGFLRILGYLWKSVKHRKPASGLGNKT